MNDEDVKQEAESKEVKMTVGHALILEQAIEAIENEVKDGVKTTRKLPFKIRARFSRMKDLMAKDIKLYEDERQALIKEHGSPVLDAEGNDTGQISVTDPEKLPLFYKALDEVLLTEIDPGYKKFTKDELALIDEIDVDMTDIQLTVFFKFACEEGIAG